MHAPPLPRRCLGPEGAPEAAPSGSPTVGRDRAAALPPLRPARRRAVRHPDRRRRLGRADEHGRVPPVEQPPGRHREARRVAHRPRPDAGRPVLSCPSGGARRPRGARRAGSRGLAEDERWPRPARLRADPARPRLRRRPPRRPGLRPGGRAPPPRRRHDDLVAQGPGPGGGLRRLQPERPRPHHRCGVLRARQRHRHGVDTLPVGRARRRRAQRLHHRDGAEAVRRARRPPRRHRRRGLRHRAPAGVGRARRGRRGEPPPEPEDDTGKP